MPIPWIDQRQPRFRRIGRIRMGHKAKSQRTGSEYPVADPYFVLTDALDLVELLGERPTTIPIEFIFDDLELTFPHYMRRYSKSGLLCLGGETVLYRKVQDGPKWREDVKDGKALDAAGKIIWDGDHQERARTIPCDGESCPYYTRGECKPTGFLRFIVRGAERQGFYDIVCHQRAVFGILAQLRMTAGLFGHLTGIPFLLHRGEPEDVIVNTPDKGPVPMKIRTQWVEVEPEWFAANFARARQLRLAYAQERAQERRLLTASTIALFDGNLNGDEPLSVVPAVQTFAPPVYPAEGQETSTVGVFTEDAEDEYTEADDPNPVEEIEVEPPAPEPPVPPASNTPAQEIIAAIREAIGKAPGADKPTNAALKQQIGKLFATRGFSNDARHHFQQVITGGSSLETWNQAECLGLLNWSAQQKEEFAARVNVVLSEYELPQ